MHVRVLPSNQEELSNIGNDIYTEIMSFVSNAVLKVNREEIIGIILSLALCAHANPSFMFTVAPDGTGTHTTINGAVKAAPENSSTTIYMKIKEGRYKEHVLVPKWKPNIYMIGEGINKTIVYAKASHKSGSNTANSATFAVEAEGFVATYMTFVNAAGPKAGQAVAFRSNGNQTVLYRCGIQGYQDTLYIQKNPQFYMECEIHGTTDFIFGHAQAVLQNCLIIFRGSSTGHRDVLVAQGREKQDEQGGIVLHNCTMSRNSANVTEVFLGRPWKPYSITIVMQSFIDSFVSPQGWLPWGTNKTLSKAYFREYQNRGPGNSTKDRIKCHWCKSLTLREAQQFTVRNFIKGMEWIPSSIPYFPDLLP